MAVLAVSPASVQPTALGGGLRTQDTWRVSLTWAPAPELGCAFSSLMPPEGAPAPPPISQRGPEGTGRQTGCREAPRQRGRQARALWAGRGALARQRGSQDRLCQPVLPPHNEATGHPTLEVGSGVQRCCPGPFVLPQPVLLPGAVPGGQHSSGHLPKPEPHTPPSPHPARAASWLPLRPPPRPQRLLRQIYRDVHTLNRKLCLIYKCNFN